MGSFMSVRNVFQHFHVQLAVVTSEHTCLSRATILQLALSHKLSLSLSPEFGLNSGDQVRVYSGNQSDSSMLLMRFTGQGKGTVEVPQEHALVQFDSDSINPGVPSCEPPYTLHPHPKPYTHTLHPDSIMYSSLFVYFLSCNGSIMCVMLCFLLLLLSVFLFSSVLVVSSLPDCLSLFVSLSLSFSLSL